MTNTVFDTDSLELLKRVPYLNKTSKSLYLDLHSELTGAEIESEQASKKLDSLKTLGFILDVIIVLLLVLHFTPLQGTVLSVILLGALLARWTTQNTIGETNTAYTVAEKNVFDLLFLIQSLEIVNEESALAPEEVTVNFPASRRSTPQRNKLPRLT